MRHARYFGTDASAARPVCRWLTNWTSRSGSGYGRGRNSTPRATEKTAVLAPMPIASTRTVAIANAGLRRSARAAYRTSWTIRTGPDRDDIT